MAMHVAANSFIPSLTGKHHDRPLATNVRARENIDRVPIASLLPADSPRQCGVKREHVQLLLEAGNSLPPILVHRTTMRVIDGMHRLTCALERGETHIDVEYFDGREDEIFLLAVRTNVEHGLPLTLQERKNAASALLKSYAHMSDRALAKIVGLSPKTVAAVRQRSDDEAVQAPKRLGLDGVIRPIGNGTGRAAAYNAFAADATATVRSVAKATGVSVGTAHSIRRLVQMTTPPSAKTAAEDADGEQLRASLQTRPAETASRTTPEALVRRLLEDPSLRLKDHGRVLLRLLTMKGFFRSDWSGLISEIPAHCIPSVADLADAYANEWRKFAVELRQRS
jgi:ParB-like chromosome segregation protein Spo0J